MSWKYILDSVNTENKYFIAGAIAQQLIKDEKNLATNNEISDCAVYAPRMKSSLDKQYDLAHLIAYIVYPDYVAQIFLNKDFDIIKTHSYIIYQRLLSTLKKVYLEQEESKKQNVIKLKTAKDMRNNYEFYDKQPAKDAIINPDAMPVDIAPEKELNDFFNRLKQNTPVIGKDYVQFVRGAYYSDGRIDLCKQVVGHLHIQKLMESIKQNPHIKHFLLGNNIIDCIGAKSIGDFITSDHKSKIETWYIAGNRINSEGIKIIAEALKKDSDTKTLWLKRNPLGYEGVKYLGEMLEVNNNIECIDIHNVNAGDDGIKFLFESLKKNNTLRRLYIDANNITTQGTKYIADYFNFLKKNNKIGLTSIWLDMNRIYDEGAIILADGFENYPHLERLIIGSARIKANGATYLLNKLQSCKNLMLLDLGAYKSTGDMGELPNFIGDDGVDAIKKFIENNNTVKIMDISQNNISNEGLNKILDSFEKNNTLLHINYNQYGVDVSKDTKDKFFMLMERNVRNNLGMTYNEFHKGHLRLMKHTEDILKIDSIYRNNM